MTEQSAPAAGRHLAAEIATQPDDWLRAAATAAKHTEALPRPGERVAVIGCGTSFYMAQSYAVRRERAGHGITDAFAASEHALDRGYDRVLAISRSGTTTEVLRALRELPPGQAATAITADGRTPIVDLAGQVVLLAEADERSVVQTRFATSTLALLRAHLGEELEPVAEQARAALRGAPPAQLRSAEQVTFLGRGWTVGLAHEAALKLRESAQLWTESYPAMEYRHGPISIAAPGRVVWAFGEVPDGLAEQVRATGAHFEHAPVDPLAELVRVHRLCLDVAAARGLDPDRPRHLTRSIILTS
ncbi:MAG TPA: sugar isomerase [Pseudonocardia sp.]|nr:sugar isomerase [Pseudonocardia sp.]